MYETNLNFTLLTICISITYLGGNTDFTLHINEAGFPTSMLSLLGFTVTVTSGPAEPPGGMVKEVLTFNT